MVDICIVGEAWGADEEAEGKPFVGASGRLLTGLLSSVGIDRRECFVTNVFNLRPTPTNDIKNLCGPRDQAIPGMKSIASWQYIRAEFAPELQRLYKELHNESPNLIIALGGTALWALTGQAKIKANRGTIIESHLGFKVLPTYHPSAVLRQWTLRPIVMADLEKAAREAQFPDIRLTSREVWIEPTLSDIKQFWHDYIVPSPDLSIDIETAGDQITCIGFAPTTSIALVIPFTDRERADGNYWRSHADEISAWNWVRYLCALPKHIVGQNFLYDINFLWTKYGIPVPHAAEDTMLLHHALQPEMEKGLGFLGSIYTNEASWKLMRKSDTVKRED